jgi:hypothetical protein
VWNKVASRLAFHLSGEVGLRDAGSGFTGIEICLKLLLDVADRAKIEMVAKAAKKARKSSLSAAGQIMASEKGDLYAERIQEALSHLGYKDAKRIGAGNSLSDLFDGQGRDQNIANGSLLRAAIKGIVAAGPGYEIPSGGTLGAADSQRECLFERNTNLKRRGHGFPNARLLCFLA